MVSPKKNYGAALAALVLILIGLGCSGTTSDAGSESEPTPASEPQARTLAIPGNNEVPPGHPEIGSQARSGALVWDVPDDWITEEPRSNMRLAQYRVPGPDGDGECVVFYFGPGQGGDPMANAQRWAGQFVQPDGSSSLDKMTVSTVEGTRVGVQVVRVTGTYTGGMTMTTEPAKDQPGSMLLAAIAEGPDAPWFFKLTGPEATILAQQESFLSMLRTVRPEAG